MYCLVFDERTHRDTCIKALYGHFIEWIEKEQEHLITVYMDILFVKCLNLFDA